jgi:hypothetical protein
MGWQRVASCVLTRKPAAPERVTFEAEGEALHAGRGSPLHAPIVLPSPQKKLLVNTNDYH